MKTLVLIVAIIAALAVRAAAEEYRIDDFERVSVESGIEVVITEGAGFSVTAEAIEGDIDNLRIERRGDWLTIDRKPVRSLLGFGRNERFRVEVSLPDLSELDAASGSAVSLAPEGAEPIRFDIGSGASLRVGDFEGDAEVHASSGASVTIVAAAEADYTVRASSGAFVKLEGTCGRIEVRASSGSSVAARDMTCAEARIDASSSGSVTAHATDAADLEASSGASVRVVGSPEDVRESTSSGGSVSVN